ncbi:MAG: pilus assembly protein PilP [Myxococcota bacterium]
MKTTKLALLILPLAALGACGDPPKPPPPPPAEATPPPPGPSTTEEELEAPEAAYAYSSVGKRDPFRSFFFDALATPGPDNLTELQKFQLDQLKLVAIVTGRAAPYAMVEDPTGKGHTLTRGTLLGKNWGHVATINADCVTVKEEYRDYTGRKVTNEVPICLPKKNELKLDN